MDTLVTLASVATVVAGTVVRTEDDAAGSTLGSGMMLVGGVPALTFGLSAHYGFGTAEKCRVLHQPPVLGVDGSGNPAALGSAR